MKTVLGLVFILSTVLAINAIYTEGHDGRPACRTQEEIQQKVWRNNNNPISYWVCSRLNEPASSEDCPTETGFMTSAGNCVEWYRWQWEEPIDPPSMSI